jgi:hypothetical protein
MHLDQGIHVVHRSRVHCQAWTRWLLWLCDSQGVTMRAVVCIFWIQFNGNDALCISLAQTSSEWVNAPSLSHTEKNMGKSEIVATTTSRKWKVAMLPDAHRAPPPPRAPPRSGAPPSPPPPPPRPRVHLHPSKLLLGGLLRGGPDRSQIYAGGCGSTPPRSPVPCPLAGRPDILRWRRAPLSLPRGPGSATSNLPAEVHLYCSGQ